MNILFHIFNTIFFIYQHPFCDVWDKQLNRMIRELEVVRTSQYTITFRLEDMEITVWAANKWYAFGNVERINGKGVSKDNQRRPRFSTMQRLAELHQKIEGANRKSEYNQLMERLNG